MKYNFAIQDYRATGSGFNVDANIWASNIGGVPNPLRRPLTAAEVNGKTGAAAVGQIMSLFLVPVHLVINQHTGVIGVKLPQAVVASYFDQTALDNMASVGGLDSSDGTVLLCTLTATAIPEVDPLGLDGPLSATQAGGALIDLRALLDLQIPRTYGAQINRITRYLGNNVKINSDATARTTTVCAAADGFVDALDAPGAVEGQMAVTVDQVIAVLTWSWNVPAHPPGFFTLE